MRKLVLLIVVLTPLYTFATSWNDFIGQEFRTHWTDGPSARDFEILKAFSRQLDKKGYVADVGPVIDKDGSTYREVRVSHIHYPILQFKMGKATGVQPWFETRLAISKLAYEMTAFEPADIPRCIEFLTDFIVAFPHPSYLESFRPPIDVIKSAIGFYLSEGKLLSLGLRYDVPNNDYIGGFGIIDISGYIGTWQDRLIPVPNLTVKNLHPGGSLRTTHLQISETEIKVVRDLLPTASLSQETTDRVALPYGNNASDALIVDRAELFHEVIPVYAGHLYHSLFPNPQVLTTKGKSGNDDQLALELLMTVLEPLKKSALLRSAYSKESYGRFLKEEKPGSPLFQIDQSESYRVEPNSLLQELRQSRIADPDTYLVQSRCGLF